MGSMYEGEGKEGGGLELKMPYGDRRIEFVLDNEIVRLLCNCYFAMVFETDSVCDDSFLRK